jgi:hypothetical protein
MIKYTLIFVLLLRTIALFSQDNSNHNDKIVHMIDSLTDWSYDILSINQNDTNLICQIVFFRNREIQDSMTKSIYGKGLRPSMTFRVYPATMIDTIKKISSWIRRVSSCVYPSAGGDYYTLHDFVLINHSVCVECGLSHKGLDLCRGNIENILSKVKNKHYSSIGDLLNDLPVRKERSR